MTETETVETAAPKPQLEAWSANERMRHVPPIDQIVRRLDASVRGRLEKLSIAYAALPRSHPDYQQVEAELRTVCRAIERVGEVARPTKGTSHPPNDPLQRIGWSLSQALSALGSIDANLFGRRYPFQTFERSKAEPVLAALLVVLSHIEDRLLPLVRRIDMDIDEQLSGGIEISEVPMA